MRSNPSMKKLLLPILCFLAASLLPCRAETIIALMADKKLRYFDSGSPGTFTKVVNLTGIPTNAAVVTMDFRPPGQLFVLAIEDGVIRLYEIDLGSGAATWVGSPVSGWSGIGFGFDISARAAVTGSEGALTSDADVLRRISPDGVGVQVTLAYDNTTSDGDPVDQHAGDNPAIVALAHSNSFPEAQGTVLYGIDALPNSLVVVNSVSGQLNTVGPLGVDTGFRCGFDISGVTGIAYAALSSGEFAFLYTIDLGTGAATQLGQIGSGLQVTGLVDIAAPPPTRLLNISTRSRVGTGDDAMIGGFITQGGASTRLIIRGIGPSLAALGVPSPLADPILTVFNSNGAEIASNDNWKSTQQAEITASQLAPTNDLEAAYIGIFAPGAYTAQVRGVNDTTGIGLVEVFKLSDQ